MELSVCRIIFIYFSLLTCELSTALKDLGGKWLLKDSTGKYVDIPAVVPGGIYTDLMNNKIIDDIFYGYNDDTTKWVPRQNWTYYRNFSVDGEVLQFENVNLVFEGLDTFADILLNGVKVGESKNMFMQYIFDIKEQIKVGTNNIEIQFKSPVEVASALAIEQEKKSYSIPQTCPPAEYRGECHVNMIRKMQASFSWDFSGSYPSVGIWKPIFIEAFNNSVIRYVMVDTKESEDKNSWILNITTYFSSNKKQEVRGSLSYEINLIFVNLSKVVDVSQKPNNYSEIVVTTVMEFPKGYVNTWWPNGYGGQDLYTLNVTFVSKNESEMSSKWIKVGFRTVELIQDALDSGLTFYFKVNNVPIFMKGTNEIPINILPERGQNKTTIAKLLSTVRDSNMNMVRVWGGGVYESEYFYDVADELGILIWQDFMFAYSLYPATDEFLSNVIEEVRHQVKRLQRHTSIVLFSGNNENEGYLQGYRLNNLYNYFKKDYVKLYIDTIKTEFDRLTRGQSIFISSSPSNGKESEKDGYVSNSPGSSFYGDVHFYNYIFDPFDPNTYPTPRFASEYGYQSLPSMKTLLTATNNVSDLNINSAFLDHRQHHPLGNVEMLLLMEYQFKLPDPRSENFSQAFIFYSQIYHATSIKIETQHYRRYKTNLDEKGQGYTMGALYWQLNDVWVAPTWAGIDFKGRWKILQYYTQEFFAPIIIMGELNVERELEIYVVSDLLSPVLNATAVLQVYKWDSVESVFNKSLTVNLEAGYAQQIDNFGIDEFLSQNKCGSLEDAKKNCFVYLSLDKEGVKIAPDNFVLPTRLKESNLQQPELKITTVTKISNEGAYSIQIYSDVPALFVWLESTKVEGRFSENGFLQNTKYRTIYFYSELNTSSVELVETLTITNLLDKQYSL